MSALEKTCPAVCRSIDGALQVLAFRHPLAGSQCVKGTIEAGESPAEAASRELREESGIIALVNSRSLGRVLIGKPPIRWHLYAFEIEDLPRTWEHQTEDDFGHVFRFSGTHSQ